MTPSPPSISSSPPPLPRRILRRLMWVVTVCSGITAYYPAVVSPSAFLWPSEGLNPKCYHYWGVWYKCANALGKTRYLFQNGFDVNARTKTGDDTLLHLVVERIDVKESFPLVLKLLEYSPDLQIRNKVRLADDIIVYFFYSYFSRRLDISCESKLFCLGDRLSF